MSLTSANGEEEGQPEPDLSLKNSKGDGANFLLYGAQAFRNGRSCPKGL